MNQLKITLTALPNLANFYRLSFSIPVCHYNNSFFLQTGSGFFLLRALFLLLPPHFRLRVSIQLLPSGGGGGG